MTDSTYSGACHPISCGIASSLGIRQLRKDWVYRITHSVHLRDRTDSAALA